MWKLAIVAGALMGAPSRSEAAEVAVAPSPIVQYQANSRGYVDLIVHATGIRAGNSETLTIDRLTINLVRDKKTVLSRPIEATELVRDTQNLASAPVEAFIAGQLLNPRGLQGFFGDPTVAGTSPTIAPGQALVTSRHYFAVSAPIDAVIVEVDGRDGSGKAIHVERSIAALKHMQSIAYHAPLRGTWLMRSMPSLQSHHRFNPPTEFALDFFKVDGEGEILKGSPMQAENYFGFGAPVYAAADGEIVKVIEGIKQDRSARNPHPGEARDAAMQRISMYNMQEFQRDFEKAAAGNMVVIRHSKDGSTEYSSYGHLQADIPVHVGDRIRSGDLIGRVGDTGDSADVHLHFQVNAKDDPFSSRSLPVKFDGLEPAGGDGEPGTIVSMD